MNSFQKLIKFVTRVSSVLGSLGWSACKLKMGLCHEIIVPTITYTSETWVWNENERSSSGIKFGISSRG